MIRTRNEKARNALAAWLKEKKVETLIHYPVPLHKQPVFKNIAKNAVLPKSEIWAKTVLSIPMHPDLTNDDVHYVSERIHEFFNEKLYENKEWIKRGTLWLKKYM